MARKQKTIPPPLLVSAIVCDMVIVDVVTRKPSVIGIFENISATKYPARHPRLAFFFELTNGHEKTKIIIRLVDVQEEDKILFEWTVEREFTDVRQVVSSTFDIGWIQFPHPGEYRFQIFAGTDFLGERRIICREVELSTGGENDESKNA